MATGDAILPTIAVFARAPTPGQVKTRLIPALGAERAAKLHRALVRRTLQTIHATGFHDVTLWCAPDSGHPFFAQCQDEFGVVLASQPPGDLGARMAHVFERHAPCLLVGSDCPSIKPDHLRTCVALLADFDAVFLPAEDGGYGLVGLRAPAPALFADMIWSTPDVMAQTRERLGALRMKHAEPFVIWDVDEPADLVRLERSGLFAPDAWA